MGGVDRKRELRRRMEECRAATLELLERVPDEFLRRRVHAFYSPIGWHFGHVGRTEEYWVLGQALGRPLLDDRLTFLFADLTENPKDNRVNIPDREGIVDYLARTRASVWNALEDADLDSDSPYLADGYAWDFAVQHEYQHQETIFEMLHLIQKEVLGIGVGLNGALHVSCPVSRREWVDLSGGEFEMGSAEPNFYDNEKRPHPVKVGPFRLRKEPVTALEWVEFIEDGGYRRRELWSDQGWDWRESEKATCPEYWVSRDGEWRCIGPKGLRTMHADEPASCISWYEAEAFSRWADKRLPTEEEWEWARKTGGQVNIEADVSRRLGAPAAVTEYPPDSLGLVAMAGSVWQWTSSPFLPYQGFVPFPYDGYSWDHMKGAHYVCRGGSWATSEPIRRPTFRNWYVPGYRQGFLGLRLAE